MHADRYAAALTAGWARRVSPLRARRPLRPYVRNVDVLRGQSQPAGRSSRLLPPSATPSRFSLVGNEANCGSNIGYN